MNSSTSKAQKLTKSGTVHEIICDNCNLVYFGHTKLPLKISEHKRVCLFAHDSTIPCHVDENKKKWILVLLKLLDKV